MCIRDRYCGVHSDQAQDSTADDSPAKKNDSQPESPDETELKRRRDWRQRKRLELVKREELERSKLQRRERQRRIQFLAVLASTLAGIITLVAASYSAFLKNSGTIRSTGIETQLLRDVNELEKELAKRDGQLATLSSTLNEVQSKISQISNAPPTIDGAKQFAAINSDLKSLADRLEIIEKGLLDNPEKALSTVLLRSQLKSLENKMLAAMKDAENDVDRIYDQNKWFLGLMGTMAVGLIGLAISNFFQIKKPSAQTANNNATNRSSGAARP